MMWYTRNSKVPVIWKWFWTETVREAYLPGDRLAKSGTRREDLLLTPEELEAINIMRKALNGLKPDEATDRILDMFAIHEIMWNL